MPNATQYNESLFRQAIELECSHLNVSTLVDIGSGDGGHTSTLAKLCRAKKIICLDHDPKILLKAKRRGFDTIQADLNQKIPLKTNTADLVIVDQVIEHIAKTDLLVAEVYRILKPGGIALWSTPNLASWHNIVALTFGYQPFSSQVSDQAFLGNPWHPLNHHRIHEVQAHLRLFTKYSLSDLLKYHRFTIDKVVTIGYYPFNSKIATWMAAVDPIHAAYLLGITRKNNYYNFKMINPIVYLTERIFSAKPLETNLPEFNLKSIHQGHHRVTYKGIRCLKCPFDYVMYQMILWETKPDLIIEIGTLTGGGTLYLADILDQIGKGQIHSIDIVNQSDPLVKKHKRIKLFYDGWEKYPLPDRRKFKKIIVIDDGAHTYEQVRDALTKFSPLINKNSYYIIEDGILSYLKTPLKYHGGPIRAIDEFLSQNNHFVIDKRWRDMFGFNTTFNTNGYLKRI